MSIPTDDTLPMDTLPEVTTHPGAAPASGAGRHTPAHPPAACEIWRTFHWSFFVDVQALIICLRRFGERLAERRYPAAEQELRSAAELLAASGAAMQLAGSFSRGDYSDTVRPSMMPPQVRSDNFSGLMCWEHAVLMLIWRELRPVFSDLPGCLSAAHEDFVRAYYDMALGHTRVCEKFVGAESSIRSRGGSGIETLKRFNRNRAALIDPQQKVKGCPFEL